MALELTLEAAIRDADSERVESRNLAIRNLAPAYLESLQLPNPTLHAADLSPMGEEVLHRLLRCAESDPLKQIRGLALIGIGQLGSEDLLDLIGFMKTDNMEPNDDDAIETEEHSFSDVPDHGEIFVRECAVISCSLLVQAASEVPHPTPQTQVVYQNALHLIEGAARSPWPELRFQAITALTELNPHKAEERLLEAWNHETNLQVQSHIVQLFSQLSSPISGRSQGILCEFMNTHSLSSCPGVFDAALGLVAAHRKEAGATLIEALEDRTYRDRALEAIAALGPIAPRNCIDQLRRWSNRFILATPTNVRAAYALARIVPDEGLPLLNRFRKHPRKSIREAVSDAFNALASWEQRGSPLSKPSKLETE